MSESIRELSHPQSPEATYCIYKDFKLISCMKLGATKFAIFFLLSDFFQLLLQNDFLHASRLFLF